MARKPGTGRRSTKMELIPSKTRRQVTFSKRRPSLFQKAHELVSLCGGQIALFVPSPSGNTVYSFGCPGVNQVLERVENPSPQAGGAAVLDGENATVRELNLELARIERELAVEKERGAEVSRRLQEIPVALPTGLPELEEHSEKLEQLKLDSTEELSAKEAEELSAKEAEDLSVSEALLLLKSQSLIS